MSILNLTAENRNGQTVITHSSFTAPLKIAQPFYRDGYTEVMMMAAAAGILEGDFYDISLTVRKGAALKFTEQSYTKIFKSGKKGSSRRIRITVESGGRLHYLPTPTIPFAGSAFCDSTEIHLESGSKFIMTDILSAGRIAMNERFAFKSYRTRTAVYSDERLCFLDNRRLVPSKCDLAGIGFFEGYSHCGMMYIFGENIGDKLPKSGGAEAAMTKAKEGICIRAFGSAGEDIAELFADVIRGIKQ
ncbi:MAG: urease accessory protein UreD [Oscillospiraceae bacterium]|nr:urease accessory protein UreD [Oscillospiraceae bacterium]